MPLFGPVALGTIALLALRWRMNVMSLPDEEARALGVPTGPLRIVIVAAATLVTSASVATAGIIGWVGLVVPHIARTLVGPDFGRLIPAAALIGGGFLLAIDTLARTMAPIEIPLGILTAFVGTPFFIWLLASVSQGVVRAMMLEGRSLAIGYRDRLVGSGLDVGLAHRRGAGAARPQWRRQDHAAEDPARPARAARRARCGSAIARSQTIPAASAPG